MSEIRWSADGKCTIDLDAAPSAAPTNVEAFLIYDDSDDEGEALWFHREGDEFVPGPPAPHTANGITYTFGGTMSDYLCECDR